MTGLLLGAVTVAPKDVAIIVLTCACVALVIAVLVVVWFRKDTEQELRLRAYAEVAEWLSEICFPGGAEIFRCLNTKDGTGTVRAVHNLVAQLKNKQTRFSLLDDNFVYQLGIRIKDPMWAEKIGEAWQAFQDSKKAATDRLVQKASTTANPQ